MFLKTLFSIALCACAMLVQPVCAQTVAMPQQKLLLKFSPQHLLFNGLHLEVEKSLNPENRHSITLSPHVYFGETNSADMFAGRRDMGEEQGKVRGYGGEMLHRFYTSKTTAAWAQGAYLAYGANFHWFNVEFKKNGWTEETGEDGLSYYKYSKRPFNEKINRWGGVVMAGKQVPVQGNRILTDWYVGIGYKHSNSKTNYTAIRYSENGFDFGYTGFHLVAGFKLGVVI